MAYVKPTFILVRAIGALFARRILRTVLIIGVMAAIILHGLGVWLTTVNQWWWLLETVLIFLTVLFVILILFILLVLRIVEPRQDHAQKQAVRAFVEKFEHVIEGVRTPLPLIVVYMVRDTVWPREQGNFIEGIVSDSKTLAPDFAALHKQFNPES
jgi:hypothetical protein